MDSTKKKIIINADDYGISLSVNRGIEEAYKKGMLTSTSVITNGEAYSEADIKLLRDKHPHLGIGLHLNVIEGRSSLGKQKPHNKLCHKDGRFKHSFLSLFLNSFNSSFLAEVERDFRHQIETLIKDIGSIDHLNSHQYCNTPPAIFDISCKLAREYGITYIRVANEKIVISKVRGKIFTKRFSKNVIKYFVLKVFTFFNLKSAKKHNVQTNDSFIGVLYTGFMDESIIRQAVKTAKPQRITEILLHPSQISGEKEERFWPKTKEYTVSHHRRRELELLCEHQLLRDILVNGAMLTQYRKPGSSLNEQKVMQSEEKVTDKNENSLRLFLIIDETTFFHPEFVDAIANELPFANCIGACRVVLPRGGVLQHYLLKNWRALGVRQLLFLIFKTLGFKSRGMLPQVLRNGFKSSVNMALEENHIPFLTISSFNKSILDYISNYKPDVILSSNSLIFPRELIDIPKLAAINRHSSLLPSYGGILPVFRAVQFDEKYCGVSVHKMTKEIDKGEILSRKWLPLEKGDSLFMLYKLLFVLSFEALKETLEGLSKNKIHQPLEHPKELTESYYSFPTVKDWKEFKENGGRFI